MAFELARENPLAGITLAVLLECIAAIAIMVALEVAA